MAHPRPRRAAARLALALAALGSAAACGDDPFEVRWVEDPDTVVLYSLARPELNLPSAFDFHSRTRWLVQTPIATGNWDVALDTRDGELVLLPPGALGIESRAGIAPIDTLTFEALTRAPTDSASYVLDAPVPVRAGTVYAIRTHQAIGGFFGTRCVFYAKMEPLAIDAAAGTLSFVFDESPACNNPSLIPPD